jgi:carbon storage regulator
VLVLSRRVGEEIVIDGQIRIVVAAAKGDRVRLGICAPATVRVNRQEVHERRSFSLCLQTPGLRGSLPSQEDDGCRG